MVCREWLVSTKTSSGGVEQGEGPGNTEGVEQGKRKAGGKEKVMNGREKGFSLSNSHVYYACDYNLRENLAEP